MKIPTTRAVYNALMWQHSGDLKETFSRLDLGEGYHLIRYSLAGSDVPLIEVRHNFDPIEIDDDPDDPDLDKPLPSDYWLCIYRSN